MERARIYSGRSLLRAFLAAMVMAVCDMPSLSVAQDVSEEGWDNLKLWYESPAPIWDEALPVGNGRLGAMIFGATGEERIQLNEETLWSGGPYDPTVEGAHAALDEIRSYLFEGDIEKAHDLFGRSMMGVPYEQMKYQPLGDLLLHFPGHEEVEDYSRELDLDRALVTVSYRIDGIRFKREIFSSAVDQVIVIRISSDTPGTVSFSANLHGARNTAHSNYDTGYFQMDGLAPNELRLTGKSTDYLGIEGKLRYEARLSARSKGGVVDVDYRTLNVRNADSATLLVAAATNFNNYSDVSGDEHARVETVLDRVSDRSFDTILDDHLAEHRNWFRRVRLELGSTGVVDLPTDERIARLRSASDPQLAALYYQFGRYLLISSSRPRTQPANLQGIWNDNSNPWWDSKYTVNINLPMNYWPAESANLAELVNPLEGLLTDVSEAGRSVAREHWNAPGWVLHQNTDLWRATAPMDGPSWGAWPVGGAWLSTHLMEQYRYGGNREGLERMYPVLKGAVEFISDILVEHPENGLLVTAPSNSPENFPAWPGNGRFFDEVSGIFLKARTMTAGPTMDMQIIRRLFSDFAEVSTMLGQDEALRMKVLEQRERLAPNQIGKHGQIQEWMDDWDEIEPEHRHLSHLWGLYPGSEISPRLTPELAAAAEISMIRRGTGGCGWSYGWKIALWARLLKGEPALEEFKAHLLDSSLTNLFSKCGRALQVDGNFGATAGISEMLLQSHEGSIELIPALPTEWATGSVDGMRARGGFDISFSWSGGRVSEAAFKSVLGNTLNLRTDEPWLATTGANQTLNLVPENGIVSLPTIVGGTYRLRPNR